MSLIINQCWPQRREAMLAVIQSFPFPIEALEIGCWFGEGSTKVWMENVKPGSNITLIDAWKPYATQKDLNSGDSTYRLMDNAASDAFLSTIINVKKMEQVHSQNNINVSIIKSEASKFLSKFADNLFDFIYVDGDHRYENAKSDIVQSKRLIKKTTPYAIICGDDLELQPTPERCAFAKLHKDRDYVEGFHPGVLLAISEEFSEINIQNGFWWIIVRNGQFVLQ
jgi:hypothetical protein